jgi:hypothetical protein
MGVGYGHSESGNDTLMAAEEKVFRGEPWSAEATGGRPRALSMARYVRVVDLCWGMVGWSVAAREMGLRVVGKAIGQEDGLQDD